MAEYDLTKVIGNYLDKHLVLSLLEFLETNQVFPTEEILQGKLALLSTTNMVDFAKEIYQKLHQTKDVPEEMIQKRKAVLDTLKSLRSNTEPLLNILKNEDLVQKLISENNLKLSYLKEKHGVTEDHVEALLKLAKFQYECGNYSDSIRYLSFFRELSSDPEKKMSALWGKLAVDILVDSENNEQGVKDLEQLKDHIDKSTAPPLVQLQQGVWLLHWSLFVYFPTASGRNDFVDWLFSDGRYMNTLQTSCPHLLRYLTAAVVTSKKRKTYLKNLVEIIEQESAIKDPITEFIDALYIKFDFETAQERLKECEKVLHNDYFLKNCKDEFIENARLFIFETYCKIHSCMDINMLAKRLDMNVTDAERWIVNLIRNAKLDAKIDSAAGTVLISTNQPPLYQQLIDKTKSLSLKVMYIEREHARSKTRVPTDKKD
eukprot:TRINITY_DN4930_c0_g6_i1.p1 TRINITY_DN4930_c0_g6~~TRINITY_DN4930_c0_g6_i1.p1  ORF type:complete len:459 (+),score=80.65 TRINITY_DN4930_c0_g6_i1:85-1377(+)